MSVQGIQLWTVGLNLLHYNMNRYDPVRDQHSYICTCVEVEAGQYFAWPGQWRKDALPSANDRTGNLSMVQAKITN